MHELETTRDVLTLVLKHATRIGGARVTRIDLALGEMSSLTPEALTFYFDQVSRGTAAEDVHLVFHRIQAYLQCENCGTTFPLDQGRAVCSRCGHQSLILVGAREVRLQSIEASGADGSTQRVEIDEPVE